MSTSTGKPTMICADGQRVEFPLVSRAVKRQAAEARRAINELYHELEGQPSRKWDLDAIRGRLREWALVCNFLAEAHGMDVHSDKKLRAWREGPPTKLHRLLLLVENKVWNTATKNWEYPEVAANMAGAWIAQGNFKNVS